jgi:gamma-glutamyl hercynylcysteine S-oxide synthase
MNVIPTGALSVAQVAELLAEARARTQLIIAPLSDTDLRTQHDALMSPMIWDLGHIAHFEEVWLIESPATGGGGSEGLRGMYNPFENPRNTRDALALPSRGECWNYMAQIRREVLSRLEAIESPDDATGEAARKLLREGFVFRLVLQHEYQHNETILQTLQLKQGEPYVAVPGWALPDASLDWSELDPMVRFPGGTVPIGTDDSGAAYDNEKPAHEVELKPFWMDRTPVTNGAFLAFVEDGGYERCEFWSEAGERWRSEGTDRAPKHWRETEGGWRVRTMNRDEALDPLKPVCHVCYYEAEAYARYSGKRLPTEFEWEAAATFDPRTGKRSDFPWGDAPANTTVANLDALSFGTARVGAFEDNVSPIGCYGMIGDVWEWTSTDFHGYPGYETFPYPEYSEVFFGDEYKVLRGGSWATRTGAIRSTFRNWDYPIRRQIFAGFRCARDDDESIAGMEARRAT